MRPLWKDVLAAVWLGIILPGIVLNAFVLKERHRQLQTVEAVQRETVQNTDFRITLLNPDGTSADLPLERYLTGVLLAEMPAEFHPEALKAQAVAARTYTWKAHTTGSKHGGGSLCTEPACCQAYITEEAFLSQGGTSDQLEKIRQAVGDTSGYVLAYDGELIEATYFSSAQGSTESALAVWGTDYPYLQAVSSPEEGRFDTIVYAKQEFEKLLGIALSEDPEEWFGAIAYTDGGGVESLEICGNNYTGLELRKLLGLRSTAFQIQAEDSTIAITTRGYGHRVGMSQYGANTMAQNGTKWQQILQHYYPGTNLIPVS